VTAAPAQGRNLADWVREAETAADALEAASRYSWRRDRGEDCPPDRIATPAALARWLAGGDAGRKLEPAAETLYWAGYSGELLTDFMAAAAKLAPVQFGAHARQMFEAMQRDWQVLWKAGKNRPSPLVALVEVWQQDQARPVAYDDGAERDRILPTRLAMIDPADPRAGKLFLPAGRPGPKDEGGRQLVLMGFEKPRKTAALPLALYHLGIGDRAAGARGVGAPLALRMFVEIVLAVGYDDRLPGDRVRVSATTRDLMRRFWPAARWLDARNFDRLLAAALVMDSPDVRVPVPDPVAKGVNRMWRVVGLQGYPDRFDPDAEWNFTVDLPAGAGAGPAMPDALNAWGARSAAAYNLLINLAYEWHRPGRLVRPVGKGKRRHWNQVQDPGRYPDYSDEDLIDLCYPVRPENRRRANVLADAQKAVEGLAAAGGLRIESGRRSVNRKLLPANPGSVLAPPPKLTREKKEGDA